MSRQKEGLKKALALALENNEYKEDRNIQTKSSLSPDNIQNKSVYRKDEDNKSISGLYPDYRQSISISTPPSPYNNDIKLAEKQFIVYNWFLNKGLTGYFNRGQISVETGLKRPTIKNSIIRLKELGLIEIDDFNYIIKQQYYKLNPNMQIDKNIHSISNIQSISNLYPHSPNKTDRKINNNLSIYLQNSDFWKKQGLSEKKLEIWIEEFDFCNSDFLLQQLQFAEATPELKKADKPINYLYRSIQKGGLSRPKDFEFPEERALMLKKKEIEYKNNILKTHESNRKKEKEIADQESFLNFLKNSKAVKSAIKKIEDSFISDNMKISIQTYKKNKSIDSRLEARLKLIFLED